MRKKSIYFLVTIIALFSFQARAERETVSILESSSSGKLVRLSIGTSPGLYPGEPVLFSAGNQKVAGGRVVQVSPNNTIVAVLEHYDGNTQLNRDTNYDFLFGEPFDEADTLPNYISDRENEKDNPSNEKFFTPDGRELSETPDLDDEDYTPETTLRPKMPQSRTYSTHNLSVGLALFRNRTLETASTVGLAADRNPYTTYQGYGIRYAYTFRTHYWLRQRAAALISAELMFGVYNFQHTFVSTGKTADIRVTPVGFNLRYMIEVNKLFRLYPYLGYLNNIVSATNGNTSGLKPIQGGRLFGGGGAQLVMSDSIDTRAEAGSDGFYFALVMKF